MIKQSKHIMVVAGEMSGDIHAAQVVNAIRQRNPDIIFSGLGGEALSAANVELYADLTKIAVFGFTEIFKHLIKLKKIFALFVTKAEHIKPDAVILVDYPGFNLRLAKALKKRGIKVIYYISPKVWVWKENRIKIIKKNVDRMLTIFDFETDFYAKHDVNVDFVGNPIIDKIAITTFRQEILESVGLDPNMPTIGILPGSRVQEINTMMPILTATAQKINERIPNVQFLITKAKPLEPKLINQHIRQLNFPIAVIENEFHNCINACDACLVTSGTATLETAIFEKPMVVVYKTSWLTSKLVRLFIKIKHVSLVNIIAGKEVVPECIQEDATPNNIAKRFLEFYEDPFRMETMINALKDVKNKLGEPGAAERAADIILKEIHS